MLNLAPTANVVDMTHEMHVVWSNGRILLQKYLLLRDVLGPNFPSHPPHKNTLPYIASSIVSPVQSNLLQFCLFFLDLVSNLQSFSRLSSPYIAELCILLKNVTPSMSGRVGM